MDGAVALHSAPAAGTDTMKVMMAAAADSARLMRVRYGSITAAP